MNYAFFFKSVKKICGFLTNNGTNKYSSLLLKLYSATFYHTWSFSSRKKLNDRDGIFVK